MPLLLASVKRKLARRIVSLLAAEAH